MRSGRTKCAISFVSFPPSCAGSSNCTLTGRLAESSLPLCSFTIADTVPSMPSSSKPGLCFGAWKTVTGWVTRIRAPGWISAAAMIRTHERGLQAVGCGHLLGLKDVLAEPCVRPLLVCIDLLCNKNQSRKLVQPICPDPRSCFNDIACIADTRCASHSCDNIILLALSAMLSTADTRSMA